MIHQPTRFSKRIAVWLGSPLAWVGRFHTTSSYSISFVIHLVLILLFATTALWRDTRTASRGVQLETFVETIEPAPLWIEPAITPLAEPNPLDLPPSLADLDAQAPIAPEIPSPVAAPIAGQATTVTATPQARRLLPQDLLMKTGAPVGGGFEGRTQAARARLTAERGGSAESEDAVARALAWLAAHQRRDGSWRFAHHGQHCPALCGNQGTAGTTTGATGLALLPFLGAGEIGQHSRYRETVDRGLYYLTSRMIITPRGGDLQEGSMYGHGIATIALCEAFAMTGHSSYGTAAEHAIQFIVHAQHDKGGWRYFPGQPGDTTVFGWQLMALKSARMAGLKVPDATIAKAKAFLDSVQSDGGATYGYLSAGKLPTPTAVGLLSRMYTGWPQDDPRLAAGVAYLEQLGPSRTDMYFNYYATQVMHHYEGDGWPAWNQTLRERLIATQSRRGHEHGSWFFRDKHGDEGGRLYTTALCCMILEVYYRHMPLYGQAAVEQDF